MRVPDSTTELATPPGTNEESSGRRLPFRMNLGRWGLVVSGAAICGAVVLGVLSDLGVGLSEPPPPAGDLRERAIEFFESHEARYLAYGRWEDLAVGVAFAGLIVAGPFLDGAVRARHVVVAGAAVAVVGDLIDLSQMAAIDVGRFAQENAQMTDLIAGNVFRFGIGRTSTYVWVGGILIAGFGMLVISRDAVSRPWKVACGLFGVSLIVTGLADVWGNPLFFQVAQYALAALGLAWIAVAFPHTSGVVRGGCADRHGEES